MAVKKIIWSKRASEEFKEILNFFIERNGNTDYSLKLFTEVQRLIKTLSRSELIGSITSNKITRVISMDVYLIFYEINNDTIEIVSFWDNRQDPEKRLIK